MAMHHALYGNTSMRRVYCRSCRRWTLILQGLKACCDEPVEGEPNEVKRMTQGERRRRLPPLTRRREIIAEQEGKCRYCDRLFGSVVELGPRVITIMLRWDHFEPWSYGWNNRAGNFVACCQRCNAMKSNRMFGSVDEVREFVASRWAAQGMAPEEVP
jgi:5-methylcytosine-specific restriction endonuclease McrA